MLLGMNSLVATDLVLCSHVLAIINVDLQDDHVAHGLGDLLEVGGNHLAWSTPEVYFCLINMNKSYVRR